MEEETVLVIDSGSRTTRVGLLNDSVPHLFHTRICRRRNTGLTVGMIPDYSFGRKGDEIADQYFAFGVSYLYNGASIQDTDYLARFWHHLFYSEFKIAPEDSLIMITEPIMNTKNGRQRIVQDLFEYCNVEGVYIKTRPKLALLGSGYDTGTILHVGGSSSYCVSFFEGYIIPHALKTSIIDGQYFDDELQRSLLAAGYTFNRYSEVQFIPHIREQTLFVASSREQAVIEGSRNCTLPNSKIFVVDNPCLMYEVLFNPSTSKRALHEMLAVCLSFVSPEIRGVVGNQVIITGGITKTKGFLKRLETVFKEFFPDTHIIAPPFRTELAWYGAKAVAQSSKFKQYCIRKTLYDECGPVVADIFDDDHK